MRLLKKLAELLKKIASALENVSEREEKRLSHKREQFVFKPAQRYEMYVIGRPRTVYKGRIEDVKEDELVLSAPVERSVPVFLPKGTKVMLAIVGLPSGRYEFQTEVVSAIEEQGAVPALVLRKPTVIYRRQRRTKPRARIFFKVRYQIVEHTLTKRLNFPLRGRVDGWDLSSVGMAVLFPDEVPLHTRIRVDFVLPDMGIPIRAVTEVVNSRWEEYSRKYITGLLFVDVLEEDRVHIDQYVSMLLPKHVDGLMI